MAKKNNNSRNTKGEGSWYTKSVNGIKYEVFKKLYPDFGVKQFYGHTKQEIKLKREKFENDLASGAIKLKTKKNGKNDISSSVVTLSDCVNELIEVDKQYNKNSTKNTDRKTYNYYIKPQDVALKCISDITREDMVDLMSVYKTKYSAGTINHIYNLLSQTFVMAQKREIRLDNPLKFVDKPKEDTVATKKREIKFLSDSDMNRLYDECQRMNTNVASITGKPGSPVYGNIALAIVFLMETGLRVGELLGLRYCDLDLDNNILHVRHTLSKIEENGKVVGFELTSPKTEKSIRNLPLTKRAVLILNKMLDDMPYKPDDFIVLTTNGTHPLTNNMTATLNRMLVRAGCDCQKSNLHALRHSFASRAIRAGMRIEVLSSYLGHSDVSTTQDIYVHVILEQQLQAVKALDDFVSLDF